MSLRRNIKNKQSFGAGVSIGTVVSIVLSVLLAMVISVLIVNEGVSENTIKYSAPIISLIATMTGCIVAARLVGEKLAIVSSITGIAYLLVLIGTGILFFDGGFHNFLTSILSIAIGCVLSCAICIRGKGRKIKRKRAYR